MCQYLLIQPRHIETIDLDDCCTRAADLAQFSAIYSVDEIGLYGMSVTDDVVATVTRNSHRIESLRIISSSITNQGLGCLRVLKNLRILVLRINPQISSLEFLPVDSLPHIHWLDIALTDVGDDSLYRLRSLLSLSSLDLRETNCTPEGVETLNRSLPNVIVSGF